MSGGSQHNPNGRQSQMGPGWSPLQLQMANLLARAPQAHMASERGVTWHTPTPPPHLYHVPVPSPPHPLQAMKGAAANSVFRHTATPPELFRHTPTPPDKHLMRHTPSPGDVKAGGPLPPAELYPHLGPTRDKLRPEELLAAAYARGGVDLSISRANGSPSPQLTPSVPPPHPPGAPPPAPALSVRDAPTINSLIARAGGRAAHSRVDALIERLAPSPHSVIVHHRAHTPSPPSSNEDSADSTNGVGSSKRKRKPDRTTRVGAPPALPAAPPAAPTAPAAPPSDPPAPAPVNGDVPASEQPTGQPPVDRRNTSTPPPRSKSRSGSAETIAEIAAMIASSKEVEAVSEPPPEPDAPDTIDKLKSVLASPRDAHATMADDPPPKSDPLPSEAQPPPVETAAAPKRRSARTPNSESTNVPVESPSEAKPAEPETSDTRQQPTAASFVEVENQLKQMFAGLEDEQKDAEKLEEKVEDSAEKEKGSEPVQPKRRRKSAPTKGDKSNTKKQSARRSSVSNDAPRRKASRKSNNNNKKAKEPQKEKDAYDSGSNASSSKSRGPYVQVRGAGVSPVSVSVINAGAEEEEGGRRRHDEYRHVRGRGLHASTLSLRYDATTRDHTWLCAFCTRGPHAESLGDLFGPYTVSTDCEEFRCMEEAAARRLPAEVWFHAECALWAPGLLAAGQRLWGVDSAVWCARSSRCGVCGAACAGVACAAPRCPARAHLPCARAATWTLHENTYRALCPRHHQ